MSAREVISFVDRSGGKVWLEGSKLKYQLPQDRPELLEMLKANRDMLMGFLEGQITPRSNQTQTLEALPQDLHALVRAASSGVLPQGSVKLETGLVTDFERFVMAYACQILMGDRQHALENLYMALRFWQGSLSSLQRRTTCSGLRQGQPMRRAANSKLLASLERLAIIGVLNGTEPAQAVTLAAEAKTDIALIVTGIPSFTRQQLIELEIDLNREADRLEARLKPLLEPKPVKA